MNLERSLADTTAESYASVKHTDHIDQLRLLLMLGGSVENWVVQTSFGSTGSARSGRRKGGPRLSFPARGGSSQAGSAGVRQRLKISNDCAGYHLFGGKYHLKGEASGVARTETDKPFNWTRNGAMRNYIPGQALLRLGREEESQ